MHKFLMALATVILSVTGGAVRADTVYSYQVNNAVFNNASNGASVLSLNGTWSFDVATNQVTAMNLTIADYGGSDYSDFKISSPVSVGVSNGNGNNTWQLNVASVDNFATIPTNLFFNFNSTSGAPLVANSNYSNSYTTFQDGAIPVNFILGSSGNYSVTGVAPVPEPASAALMLFGLGVIGCACMFCRVLGADSGPAAALDNCGANHSLRRGGLDFSGQGL